MASKASGDAASGNFLSAKSLAKMMNASLPNASSPRLATPFDAIALATHAVLLAVGFRLVGLGEDHKIDNASSDSDVTPELPAEWNQHAPNYAFRYKHMQSSMEYLVKINRMGDKAVIMGMALGDDKTTTFDVKVDDYISAASLPFGKEPAADTSSSDETRTQALLDVFISPGRLADYSAMMRLKIIQKLLPSLQKEGYEEIGPSESAESANRSGLQTDQRDPRRGIYPAHDSSAQGRRPPITGEFPPPDFEDPYDMTRPPGMLGHDRPGFGNIGHNDIYPMGLGPNDPLRGGLGPGFGARPGGGGMHPTFDDPLFQGPRRSGSGYNPQAPPGARYDPTGPGDGFPRFPGSGRGRQGPPNPFDSFGGNDFI